MDEPGLLTVSDASISHYTSRAPSRPASCDADAGLVRGKAARGAPAPRGMFAGRQNKPESVRPSLLTLYARAYSEIIISVEVTRSISENSNSRCSVLSTSASLSDPPPARPGEKPALLITNKSS